MASSMLDELAATASFPTPMSDDRSSECSLSYRTTEMQQHADLLAGATRD